MQEYAFYVDADEAADRKVVITYNNRTIIIPVLFRTDKTTNFGRNHGRPAYDVRGKKYTEHRNKSNIMTVRVGERGGVNYGGARAFARKRNCERALDGFRIGTSALVRTWRFGLARVHARGCSANRGF
ncbi:hypothetical protein EVAR_14366_1 [Eumeta japonica]|uniref:Uncharacterized protein n=1 Tax=Eumeta variegata TaxID=151549 RepID=A0A4C1TYC1_EUMVA|nr:hypothetical protein EVAR_14366_1 [Eumeta japonica]